jgi:carbamoyltransferase
MLFVAKTKYNSLFPAVTHLDNTSRIQSVNKNQNERFYTLLKEFEKVSQFPILINTSFNLSGEPIVNSPHDAINTFLNCEMDFLVIENYFISKI